VFDDRNQDIADAFTHVDYRVIDAVGLDPGDRQQCWPPCRHSGYVGRAEYYQVLAGMTNEVVSQPRLVACHVAADE
jgi:hypothetical protein